MSIIELHSLTPVVDGPGAERDGGVTVLTTSVALVATMASVASMMPALSLWEDFSKRSRLSCRSTAGGAIAVLVDMNGDGGDELLVSHSELCDARGCHWFAYRPLSTAGQVLYVGQAFFEPDTVRAAAKGGGVCACWMDGEVEKEQCISLDFDELVAEEVTECHTGTRTHRTATRGRSVLVARAEGACREPPPQAAWVAVADTVRRREIPDLGRLRVEQRPDAAMVLALARDLDAKSGARLQAFERLARLREAAAPAIPSLICLIEEEITDEPVAHGGDSDLREATQTLSAIGPEIIPPILQVLDASCGSPAGTKASIGRPCRLKLPPHEEDGRTEYCGSVRYRLASALGGLDPQGIPALIAAFRQPGPRRPYLAHAIGVFGPLAAAAIPELVAGLDAKDENLGLDCAVALGEIGPAARQALPALRSLLASEDEAHKSTVREAIRKIDGQGP